MTFLDTSAIYALADRADPNHAVARRCFSALLDAGTELLTHNYVLLESIALLQQRLGVDAALRLARDASAFRVEWVTQSLHRTAVENLSRVGARNVSMVDHVSFLVMQAHSVKVAFAFDRDFEQQGFDLYEIGST